MINFEYAEYVYGAIRRHNDKADKVASIESFLKSEYNKGVKSVYEKTNNRLKEINKIIKEA